MALFASLTQFLSPAQPISAPMDDPFIQLDRAKAAERLRLEERGTEQGALNLPPPAVGTFDNVESEVESEVGEHYQGAQINSANQMRVYANRLSSLDLLNALTAIPTQAPVTLSDFRAELAKLRNELSVSQDNLRSSYRYLRDFQTRNKLDRPAKPNSVWQMGAVIAFAWVIESLANTLLLRQNDAMGLLGGFAAAMIVAAVNVFGSAFFGRFAVPQLHHVNPVRKAIGAVLLMAWLGGMPLWNLLAAHFRDAKSAGAAVPERAALTLLSSQPFHLETIYSWGLLLAGILFAFLSLFSASNAGDPYPGYAAVSDEHGHRCEDYTSDVDRHIENLRELRDDAVETCQNVREKLTKQQRERDQVVASMNAFKRRFDEHGAYLEQVGNALLEIYRTANRKARTEDPPPHFAERWRLHRAELDVPPIPTIRETDVSRADEALTKVVEDVSQAFDETVASIEPLESLKRRLADAPA